jgi:hypothetical protein
MDNQLAQCLRLASALDYRAHGLVLVPMNAVVNGVCQGRHEISPGVWRTGGECSHKPGKHPAVKWTRYRDAGAVNDLKDIRKWVGRDQNLAVLMDCGTMRIWVADCDTPAAKEYVESILGTTPCVVETGRDGGGWHLYYRLPPGVSMKSDNGHAFVGLDIKTSGYVIAPFGRHHSGRYYVPQDGFDLSCAPVADPHLLKPVLAPSATTGAASAAQQGATTKTTGQRMPREIPRTYFYGQRNGKMYDVDYRYKMARNWLFRQGGCVQGKRGRKRLFRYTCDLVRWYLLDAHQTLTLLTEFNHRNDPPFSNQEFVDVVDRAFVLGTWSVRGQLSYIRAHEREHTKSRKSSARRAANRAEIRADVAAELMAFMVACCAPDEDGKATVVDLWTAFCDFAPWLDEHRGVFGDLLHGAVQSMFHDGARRVRGREGYVFAGVRLRGDYLAECTMAA